MSYKELLLGAGSRHVKVLDPRRMMEYTAKSDKGPEPYSYLNTKKSPLDWKNREWEGLVTLDFEATHEPDIVFDLSLLAFHGEIIPNTAADTYDEIHAYEVLEHFGQQGDFHAFFRHFSEFWRILKPGGFFCGSCPTWSSPWAWGDPGHTRIITAGTLVFLSQSEYVEQVGKTPMSDYRQWWKGDFETVWCQNVGESFYFCLRAVK